MKFREIKPGMVISWKTEDEKEALLEEFERLGYEWYGTKRKPTEACDGKYVGHAIYVYNDSGYKYITHSNNLREVTHEFSDLIIPEPELSAEEALKLYEEYCDYHACAKCKIGKLKEGNESCKCIVSHHAKEVVEILKEWKSDHEKKDPEIEWLWKSYAVGGSDYKEADTEQEAMEWCEYYAKEHPEAKCTYKHVCRVKAVKR